MTCIHHESLASFIRPTRTRPLVVKLDGDHRLSPQNTGQETKRLKEDIENQVRAVLHDRGLIFIGYGGYDQGIKMMLEALPEEALPLGVYWVGGTEPRGALRPWLEARDAIWVEKGDFDELMLLIRNAFDLPHPDRKRFEEVFERYKRTYDSLSSRIVALPDSAPGAPALKEAVKRTDETFTDEFAVQTAAKRVENTDPERADAIYAEGVQQFPDSTWLMVNYAYFLERAGEDRDRADEYYRRAVEAAPSDAYVLGCYALFLRDSSPQDDDRVEGFFKRAVAAEPDYSYHLGNYALFLQGVRQDHDSAEEFFKRAVTVDPADPYHLGNYALFLQDVRGDNDGAEEYFQRAIAADPGPLSLDAYGFFLRDIRQDPAGAEEYFRRANALRESEDSDEA